MTHKEEFEKFSKITHAPEADHIKHLVTRLIASLYVPVIDNPNCLFTVSTERLKQEHIKEDVAVNWSNLSVIDVYKNNDDTFIIYIEEASPILCDSFGDFIKRYLKSWGWESVEIWTQW